ALVGGTVGHAGITGDAELVFLLGQGVGQLGVAQQRLGGDAAHVQAHTTPVLLLHNGHRQPLLRRANGGDIPTRACSENNDVILCSHGPDSTAERRPVTPGWMSPSSHRAGTRPGSHRSLTRSRLRGTAHRIGTVGCEGFLRLTGPLNSSTTSSTDLPLVSGRNR